MSTQGTPHEHDQGAGEHLLGPTASDTWQLLLRHFELGRDFAFVLITVADPETADVLADHLSAFLTARDQILLRIPLATAEEAHALPVRLLEDQEWPRAGAIWVAAVIPDEHPELAAWMEAWRYAVARLNERRDVLRANIHVPLIFVGAPWLKRTLREMSPDLWSVRTLVLDLSAPFSTSHLQPPLAPLSIPAGKPHREHEPGSDPFLALQRAAELRSNGCTNEALIETLALASEGFLARQEWREADRTAREALALLDTQRTHLANPPAQRRLLTALATALLRQGDAAGAFDYAGQRVKLAGPQQGDATSNGDIEIWQLYGDAAQATGHYGLAEQAYERVRTLLEQIQPNTIQKGRVLGQLARVRASQLRYKEAELGFRQALTAQEAANDTIQQRIQTMHDLAGVLTHLRRREEVPHILSEALRLIDTHPDAFTVQRGRILTELAALSLTQGCFGAERSRLDRAFVHFLHRGGGAWERHEFIVLALLLAAGSASEGYLREAERYLIEAVRLLGEGKVTAAEYGKVALFLSLLQVLQGRTAEATSTSEQAQRYLREAGEPLTRAQRRTTRMISRLHQLPLFLSTQTPFSLDPESFVMGLKLGRGAFRLAARIEQMMDRARSVLDRFTHKNHRPPA